MHIWVSFFQVDDAKTPEKAEIEIGSVTAKESDQNPPASEKSTTSVKELKGKEGPRGILNAIRLPLVSVFPRRKKVRDYENFLLFYLFYLNIFGNFKIL